MGPSLFFQLSTFTTKPIQIKSNKTEPHKTKLKQSESEIKLNLTRTSGEEGTLRHMIVLAFVNTEEVDGGDGGSVEVNVNVKSSWQ